MRWSKCLLLHLLLLNCLFILSTKQDNICCSKYTLYQQEPKEKWERELIFDALNSNYTGLTQ